MIELSYLAGTPPYTVGQCLALAGAVDSAALTLQQGVPDPLWFGPSRQSFDHSSQEISTELSRLHQDIVFLVRSGALS